MKRAWLGTLNNKAVGPTAAGTAKAAPVLRLTIINRRG